MTRIPRRLVAATVALIATSLVASPLGATSSVTTERHGGDNRYETADRISRAAFASASTALVASGRNFPDALSGSSLAGARSGPIFLVEPDSIPAATANGLQALGVRDVFILGGPAAVSENVRAQLAARYSVSRVSGENRFATSAEIARRTATTGIGSINGKRTGFIATGFNFPDALGAGPLSYSARLPVFLTRPESIPPEVASAIRDLQMQHIIILGGENAVSAAVATELTGLGVTSERFAGVNRADTATKVATYALASVGFEGANVLLANGANFPDALAGGPLGGVRRGPILLTASACSLASETAQWLSDHFATVSRIIALGGPAAVCDPVLQEAKSAAETNNQAPTKVELTISGGTAATDGGPKWQHQQFGGTPPRELVLTALVTSDPPAGSTTRSAAGRVDVVFNVKPNTPSATNPELNLNATSATDGKATARYARTQASVDTITAKLKNAETVQDIGTAVWDNNPAPIALTPDGAPATLAVNAIRTYTITLLSPDGTPPPPAPPATTTPVNITSLELNDDVSFNDTNQTAISIVGTPTPGGPSPTTVTNDNTDSDKTIAIVSVPANGVASIDVRSNSPQAVTLMAFQDTVSSGSSDDNTDPPELRDKAATVTWGSPNPVITMSPEFTVSGATPVTTNRPNGTQRVYTVSAVDPQGTPITLAIDFSFDELTDGQAGTTTRAEIDWFDNDNTLATTESQDDTVPAGATSVAEDVTRIEVTPNAQGKFTVAITTDRESPQAAATFATPIAWLDNATGTPNQPESGEPQGKGQRTQFQPTAQVTHSLESLGCPPGVPQRGTADAAGAPGNPFTRNDPCLGLDTITGQNPAQPPGEGEPQPPWPLDIAAMSPSSGSSAATAAADGSPSTTNISRGDNTIRFTFRDPLNRPIAAGTITAHFAVTNTGGVATVVSAAPQRPNPNADRDVLLAGAGGTGTLPVLIVPTASGSFIGIAEIVVDAGELTSARIDVSAVATGSTTVLAGCAAANVPAGCVPISKSVSWLAIGVDTALTATNLPKLQPTQEAVSCPSGITPAGQGCYNGNVIAIDKARTSYVMGGGPNGVNVYVVYHHSQGGEMYASITPPPPPPPARQAFGERNVRADSYFIDAITAAADVTDDRFCRALTNATPPGQAPQPIIAAAPSPGCAQMEFGLSYDDRMVYEWTDPAVNPATNRPQTHRLTNRGASTG